jgi:hypothetical protein
MTGYTPLKTAWRYLSWICPPLLRQVPEAGNLRKEKLYRDRSICTVNA